MTIRIKHPGGLSSSSFVINGTVAESPDGTRTSFTTPAVFVASTLQVYMDGVNQIPTTDFTESSASTGFTMTFAPDTDEVLRVCYIGA